QLERGARLVELLKQPQNDPYPMEKAAVSIWAGTSGELDDVPVGDVRRFESEFLDSLDREHPGVLTSIRESGELSDDAVSSLKSAIGDFKKGFTTADGTLLGHEATAEPLADSEIEHETIQRPVRA
ncbi:MAG: hypothetical protein RLZ55_176, partial [Actinomycetota bacterium]